MTFTATVSGTANPSVTWHVAEGAAGGSHWNPKTSGRTYLEIWPFFRRQTYPADTGVERLTASGLTLGLEYDNTDFPRNPSIGSSQRVAVSRDLGWFGSFNEVNHNKLVVVVLLTGGRPVNGPVAAGIAGQVYKNLSQQQFFAQSRPALSPAALVESGSR